ncbi:integrase catalytic domain-containing protein [Trichonephila clavipes]|nr:integrase catalytic domain-containing protein [Trichonephila clavipes]
MPPHIQTVLSASSEPLDKLLSLLIKVSEVVGSSSTICAATTVPPPSQSSSCSAQPTMDSLVRQIQRLSLQVAELTRGAILLAINDIVLTARAFQRCKQALADAALLAHPSPSAPLALHVDASDYAIGGALHQVVDSELQPGLRKLTSSEKSYSAYDRELLAIYSAIRHFRYMLEARDFTVFTDHKPLTYDFRQKSDKCSPRQIHQLDFISQFTTNIVHIPGSDNIAADVLSCVSAITFPSQIDYDCIAETQQTDQELHTLIASGTSLELKRSPLSSFQEPSQRFDHVHLDLIGPLPPSNGYTYCLTMIDRFSKWPEAQPLKET